MPQGFNLRRVTAGLLTGAFALIALLSLTTILTNPVSALVGAAIPTIVVVLVSWWASARWDIDVTSRSYGLITVAGMSLFMWIATSAIALSQGSGIIVLMVLMFIFFIPGIGILLFMRRKQFQARTTRITT